MNSAGSHYGTWALVAVNSVVFIGFASSFFEPVNLHDWRSFGACSAFVAALFAERYGFPLTVYLLSGWLGTRFPNVDLFGHDAGHLWWLVTEQQGNPHFGVLHLLSFVFLFAGFTLLSKAWHVLHHTQRGHEPARAGPYRLVRLQWPTLPMFPVLVLMDLRLAIVEECDSEKTLGDAWRACAAATPRFVPDFGKRDHARPAHRR